MGHLTSWINFCSDSSKRAMSANAQGPKRGNDTLLTAVMAAMLNHMGTFIPQVGVAMDLTDKRGTILCAA